MEGPRKTNKELNKLKRIFKDIEKNKKDIVEKLIQNAAFMAEELDLLQEQIKENGIISEYKNGENQWGTKKSPEVEVYNAMIKNYAAIIRQLSELLPDGSKEDDELVTFLRDRN